MDEGKRIFHKVLTILHLLVQQSFDFIFVHITNHMDENITCCLRVDFIHGRKCFTKSSKISIYERKPQMLSVSIHPLVILVPTPGAKAWLIFSSNHDPGCLAHNGRGSEHSGIVHASLNTETDSNTTQQVCQDVVMISSTHLPMTLVCETHTI